MIIRSVELKDTDEKCSKTALFAANHCRLFGEKSVNQCLNDVTACYSVCLRCCVYLPTPWDICPHKKPVVARNFSKFMESEVSLPCSQQSAICTCSEPDEFSP